MGFPGVEYSLQGLTVHCVRVFLPRFGQRGDSLGHTLKRPTLISCIHAHRGPMALPLVRSSPEVTPGGQGALSVEMLARVFRKVLLGLAYTVSLTQGRPCDQASLFLAPLR